MDATVFPGMIHRESAENAEDTMKEFCKIWALSILAAICYGLAHDQVTVRICPEYFTVYHHSIGLSGNLTLLALAWGVIATWWMGAILGLPLAIAARAGNLPKMSARHLLKPLGVLLALMAVGAILFGFYGYTHPDPHAAKYVAQAKIPAFTADWEAHHASYFFGAWGALVLSAWVWSMRRMWARQRKTWALDL